MRRAGPYAVLAAEAVAFFWKVLFLPSRYVIPWDLRYYHLIIAEFLSRGLRLGELPLWDPYTYCGFPIYANLTAGLFYPPMLSALLLGHGHVLYWLELQVAAHVFLAGVFTFWLLRRLGVSALSALAGAGVYELGAFFASQTQHLGAISAAAWLPLAWLGAVALAEGFAWRRIALLAFALTMSLLAGFTAVAAVAFLSCGYLAVTLAGFRRAPWRILFWTALAGVWAIWLAAVQLIPTTELTRMSVARLRHEFMGTGGGIPLHALISLVWPDYWGVLHFDPGSWKLPWNPTFLHLYCGILGLACAIVAVLRRIHKLASVFGLVTLVSAIWMLGDHTPIGRMLFPLLPATLRGSLYPEFALAAFTLGVAVLAGMGAEMLARRPLLHGALVALVAAELIAVGAGRPFNTGSVAAEPGIDHDHFAGSTELPAKMREMVGQAQPPWRTDVYGGSIFWAIGGPLFEVPSANGNDPFALYRFMQVRLLFCKGERWGRYYQVADPDSRILDLLSVRYLMSGAGIQERPRVLPRFFFVPQVRRVKGLDDAIAAMRSPDFDPAKTAFVEGDIGPAAGGGQVRVIEYHSNRLVLETETNGPAFLVTSETHYPGWRAYVDGAERPLYYTNGAFRGMEVPAGGHRVEMRFRPHILPVSAAISAIGWAALAAVCLRSKAAKRS